MDTARYVEKIAALFGRVMASMEPEGLGLTPSQLQGLLYLYHHGESSVGEIAHGLSISHPAAVRMVDRLRKKGFVHRTESKSDRRVSLIELTEAGYEHGTLILTKRAKILSRALARVKPEDFEGVMRGLEALLAAMLEESKDVDSVCLRCGSDHIGCCVVNRTHLELTGTTIENT